MEGCRQFLDLIQKQPVSSCSSSSYSSDVKRVVEEISNEEEKIELSLGPPGGDWCLKSKDHNESSGFGYKHFSNGCLRVRNSGLLLSPPPWEGGPHGCRVTEIKATTATTNPGNTAALTNSQKGKTSAQTSVVGWPPIRSFRKNLANGSSSSKADRSTAALTQSSGGGENLLVKINMDGVPIGRKIDLKAYDGYEKLSKAVDELFKGLAAQSKSCDDASMESTLVYEDHEGDKMLVGDVPWPFFVSTVKRLYVTNGSSDVTKLHSGSRQAS